MTIFTYDGFPFPDVSREAEKWKRALFKLFNKNIIEYALQCIVLLFTFTWDSFLFWTSIFPLLLTIIVIERPRTN